MKCVSCIAAGVLLTPEAHSGRVLQTVTWKNCFRLLAKFQCELSLFMIDWLLS